MAMTGTVASRESYVGKIAFLECLPFTNSHGYKMDNSGINGDYVIVKETENYIYAYPLKGDFFNAYKACIYTLQKGCYNSVSINEVRIDDERVNQYIEKLKSLLSVELQTKGKWTDKVYEGVEETIKILERLIPVPATTLYKPLTNYIDYGDTMNLGTFAVPENSAVYVTIEYVKNGVHYQASFEAIDAYEAAGMLEEIAG